MSKKTKRFIYSFRYGNGPKIGQQGHYFIAVVPRKQTIYYKDNGLWHALWARFWEKDGRTVKLRETRKIIARVEEEQRANLFAEALTA